MCHVSQIKEASWNGASVDDEFKDGARQLLTRRETRRFLTLRCDEDGTSWGRSLFT